MDARFVAGGRGRGAERSVVVRFTAAAAGLAPAVVGRSTRSPPPAAGVWGGPFVVASATPGSGDRARPQRPVVGGERRRLPRRGAPGARARRDRPPASCWPRGELDVVMPPAATVRTRSFEVDGVSVDAVRAAAGGRCRWWPTPAGLASDRSGGRCSPPFDRPAFVGRCSRTRRRSSTATPVAEDGTWAAVRGAGDVGALKGATVDVVGLRRGADERRWCTGRCRSGPAPPAGRWSCGWPRPTGSRGGCGRVRSRPGWCRGSTRGGGDVLAVPVRRTRRRWWRPTPVTPRPSPRCEARSATRPACSRCGGRSRSWPGARRPSAACGPTATPRQRGVERLGVVLADGGRRLESWLASVVRGGHVGVAE